MTTDRIHKVTDMVTGNRWWRPLAAVALLAGVAGCPSFDIVNKNAPERERAFSDPATVKASSAGAIKNYINTRQYFEPALGPFSTMSDEHSFSWNNWQSRYYSSYGEECPMRCGWANETTHPRYEPLPFYWYGMYSVISSANDVLFAIRKSETPPDLGADAEWVEAIAQLAQGAAHALIALTYDQGFVVTEDSDPAALELVSRADVRDAAIEQLDHAATLAAAADFSSAPNTLFGLPTGPTYTGAQIAKVARTLQAELLAMFPRTTTENAQVNWGQVVTFASAGISSGTAFTWEAYQSEKFPAGDESEFGSGVEIWGDDYTTTRIDTRVGRLLATNQADPWPGGAGSPKPNAGVYGLDKRLGDGCTGATANVNGEGECAATAASGTDFMWSPHAPFNPARGQYHQSNIGYIRYPCMPGYLSQCTGATNGTGNFPILSRYLNDLIWAEGLIRTNQNLGLAAQLINNSRVTRGGLTGVSGSTSTTDLFKALYYEWHVELVSMANNHWWNGRRLSKTTMVSAGANPWHTGQQVFEGEGAYVWNPLWGNTPRSMPIPAKDLALLGKEIYTFGGPDDPTGCGGANGGPACVVGVDNNRVKSAGEIYRELKATARANSGRGGRR
jgi:hypothetical protein